jgi:histidyl-tRNA synthetase
MQRKSNTLSTEPYKGVRDFYPEDQFIQEHIFSVWKKSVERFGYEAYNASILEPTELYKAKSGQEIVNEQTYTFTDKGDREVSLRPEMTPTVARLVAGKRRELGYPLRLYSIPNLFRYERPQRGRLREHWQLNVDLFGLAGVEADIEIIETASEIMREFGAKPSDFAIKISSRKLLNSLFNDWYELDEDQSHAMKKLLDRKSKIPEETFYSEAEQIVGKPFAFLNFEADSELSQVLAFPNIKAAYEELKQVLDTLNSRGIQNIEFDPGIIRGFDYYTGIVFEVFDTDPQNNRSLFGGGRYDELMNLFGDESMPACGFGMGDVTIRDFLETRGLLPTYKSAADIMICIMTDKVETSADNQSSPATEYADKTAHELREAGINVAVNYSGRNVGDQIKTAEKLGIQHVIVIGENEAASNSYGIKALSTGGNTAVPNENAAEFVKELIARV